MVPGAFALSRTRLRGRRLIGFMIAFTLWFHAGLIPFFLNVRTSACSTPGSASSSRSPATPSTSSCCATISRRSRLRGGAARIDGASDFQLLRTVFIPLARPAIVTVALLCLVTRWNGYFWAMVLLRTEEKILLRST